MSENISGNIGGTALCQLMKRECAITDLVPVSCIHEPLLGLAQKNGQLDPEGYVSVEALNRLRDEYMKSLIEVEKGEVGALEKEVLDSISNSEILSRNINDEALEKSTLGQRVADKVASFGGSWWFISIFGVFMFAWMGINTYLLLRKPFDPYPYIFLNLVLSCLAAIQAPVIMMSQNRQEAKDRIRSEHDYQVNLKAELEVRKLHDKLDHLLLHQGQKLLDIQQMQVEMMEQILSRLGKES